MRERLVQRLPQGAGQLGDEARLDAGARAIRPCAQGSVAIRCVAAEDRRDERVDDARIENQQQPRVEWRAVQHRGGAGLRIRR